MRQGGLGEGFFGDASGRLLRLLREDGTTEATGDVGFGLDLRRLSEEGEGLVVFDEFSEVEEGGEVGDASGLFHVVGDDDDGELVFELGHQLFDLEGRDGIEGGAGFVHEEDLRAIGDGTGDAETLLLAAGKAEGAFVEFVFHFIPESGLTKAFFDDFVELTAVVAAGDAEGEDDVFVDGLGEGIVLLEDHADAFAKGDDFDFGVVEAGAVESDIAAMADAVDEVVHPVEVAQEGGFAAAGGADESGDVIFGKGEVDVVEDLLGAIPEVEVVHFDEGTR